MDIAKLATQLITEQFQGKVSEQNASSAISGLLGGDGGGLDIGSLVSKMASGGGLGDLVGSWLGDGENKGINASQLLEMFGGDKISQFSNALGVNQEEATTGLSEVLPKLVDKSSSGGNLLEGIGGIGGALNMAKKFF